MTMHAWRNNTAAYCGICTTGYALRPTRVCATRRNQLLTVAVPAKNCLAIVGICLPLQAVLGDPPGILPDLDRADALQDDSERGPARRMHRLKDISAHLMVETTANQRAQRALQPRAHPSIQTTGWTPGYTVDFCITPPRTEASGWRGPPR